MFILLATKGTQGMIAVQEVAERVVAADAASACATASSESQNQFDSQWNV